MNHIAHLSIQLHWEEQKFGIYNLLNEHTLKGFHKLYNLLLRRGMLIKIFP